MHASRAHLDCCCNSTTTSELIGNQDTFTICKLFQNGTWLQPLICVLSIYLVIVLNPISCTLHFLKTTGFQHRKISCFGHHSVTNSLLNSCLPKGTILHYLRLSSCLHSLCLPFLLVPSPETNSLYQDNASTAPRGKMRLSASTKTVSCIHLSESTKIFKWRSLILATSIDSWPIPEIEPIFLHIPLTVLHPCNTQRALYIVQNCGRGRTHCVASRFVVITSQHTDVTVHHGVNFCCTPKKIRKKTPRKSKIF